MTGEMKDSSYSANKSWEWSLMIQANLHTKQKKIWGGGFNAQKQLYSNQNVRLKFQTIHTMSRQNQNTIQTPLKYFLHLTENLGTVFRILHASLGVSIYILRLHPQSSQFCKITDLNKVNFYYDSKNSSTEGTWLGSPPPQ